MPHLHFYAMLENFTQTIICNKPSSSSYLRPIFHLLRLGGGGVCGWGGGFLYSLFIIFLPIIHIKILGYSLK